ncbi:hypothetical protein ACET3Z_004794 [Daucus carota]
MKLEDKALARRDATTHTQQTEKMASLCKDSITGDPDKAPVVIIILGDSNDKGILANLYYLYLHKASISFCGLYEMERLMDGMILDSPLSTVQDIMHRDTRH